MSNENATATVAVPEHEPAAEWVNLNLRLVPVSPQCPSAPRQKAVRDTLKTSSFAAVLRSHGWHIVDDTLE